MTDVEYEVLAIIKDSERKNAKITYLTVLNTLSKQGMSNQSIINAIQSFINNGIIECQSKNKLTTFDALVLTKQGEKTYKKENERRHPETVSGWKRIGKRFLNKILSNIIDDAARRTSRFIIYACLIGAIGVIGFIIGILM